MLACLYACVCAWVRVYVVLDKHFNYTPVAQLSTTFFCREFFGNLNAVRQRTGHFRLSRSLGIAAGITMTTN